MTIAKGEKCFYESKTNCDDGYVNCDVCGPESFFDQLGKYENNARQPSDYCWSSTTGSFGWLPDRIFW